MRTNSRRKLKSLTRKSSSKYVKKTILAKDSQYIKRRVAIPYFRKMGFPFIIIYFLECDRKPINSINSLHVNNCYRLDGESTYAIEAMFSDAQQVEDYEEIIREDSLRFAKHYIVEDTVREAFLP
jgi:hypothetical protein